MIGSGLAVQVVSFDWPWPATYGGVIDVAAKVEALLAEGVDVTLHVVAYPRADAAPAAVIAGGRLTVYRYARRRKQALLSRRPFIVSSRAVATLLPNLASGPEVILFEGVHTAAYLGHPRLAEKLQLLRLHNREADYYSGLAAAATSWRRWFFAREARLLKAYEPQAVGNADLVLPITRRDAPWCEAYAPGRVATLTPFVHLANAAQRLSSEPASGPYALFHASFHVADNVDAARRLVRRFAERPEQLVLAGRAMPTALIDAAVQHANVRCVDSPTGEDLNDLIAEAHVVVLDSRESAGFKLKLLRSLASAKRVVCSPEIAYGAPHLTARATALDLLTVCETEADWQRALDAAFAKTGEAVTAEQRANMLENYRPEKLARELIERVKRLLSQQTESCESALLDQ